MKEFRSLVAGYLQEITLRFSRPELDMAAPPALDGGSYIFPRRAGELTGWRIFSYPPVGPGSCVVKLTFRGRISADVDPRIFVSLGYRHVLGRTADPEGLELYISLLRGAQLSEQDVLCLLAVSDEAQNSRQRLIIVPEPSRWLLNLRDVGRDGSEQTQIIVMLTH